jgi:hypothetical protein
MKSLRKNLTSRTDKLAKVEGRASETENASRSFSKSAEEYNDKHLSPAELKVAQAQRTTRASERESRQEERRRELERKQTERAARVAKLQGFQVDRETQDQGGAKRGKDSKSSDLKQSLIPEEDETDSCCGCVIT